MTGLLRRLLCSPTLRAVRGSMVWVLFAAAAVAPSWAQAPCTLPDNGSGTVDLPPAGCGYVSPVDLHHMIAGLPPGTEIRVAAQHRQFFNVVTFPGGGLGGEVETFDSTLFLNLQGTGGLAYHRVLNLVASCETHVGPRSPGDPVQSFDTEMFALQGQLPPGDPDFDLLKIKAGTGLGQSLPSPGHTTLTRLPDGTYNVDSFFDIFYEIEYVGAPGGPFSGMSGSTTGTIRMQGGTPAPNPLPCTLPDNGTGTVNLPPAGCGYVSPAELHRMIDGLPPGTQITVAAEHNRFFNVTSGPGGTLGGEVETFQSQLQLHLEGLGLVRDIPLQVACETHIGPRTPGDPVQSFDTEMFRLQGQLPPGDPDFDLLRIRGGSQFGMPSPGHTTLTRLPSGDFNVDSFFDITYQIDFAGAPGGPLAGMSGSTTATIKMKSGQPKTTLPTCIDPGNGAGTVSLPPAACGYLSPDAVHKILAGLPPGTEIELGPQHHRFFNVTSTPGGTLGGRIEQFDSALKLNLQGTDFMQGFSRLLSIPVACETHTGPRTPGLPVQSFDTEMFRLQGQLPAGDPDFDLLRVTAGAGNGWGPSPGHTTLTLLPGGGYAVDSFFDIFYEIEFIGAPGGHFGGMSGSTTATIRMQASEEVLPPVGTPALSLDQFPGGSLLDWTPVPEATGYDVVCGSLATLRASGGDFVMATGTCLQNDQPSTSAPHAANPPANQGVFCTVRGVNVAGFGTYNEGGAQVGDRDAEIQASGMACP